MTHDPLCPFAQWDDEHCFQRDAGVLLCDLIAKVREDMLAKCIDWMLDPHHHPSEEAASWAYAYAEALRGLQEKP